MLTAMYMVPESARKCLIQVRKQADQQRVKGIRVELSGNSNLRENSCGSAILKTSDKNLCAKCTKESIPTPDSPIS